MSTFAFSLGNLRLVADTVGLVAFSSEVVDPQGRILPILVQVEGNPDLALEIGLQLKALTEIWWRILMPQVRDAQFRTQRPGGALAGETANQETTTFKESV